MGGLRVKLSDTEIRDLIPQLTGWSVVKGQLTRTFETPTYATGVLLSNAIAYLADAMDHHPDLTISYRKVTVRVSTHDVGGLSPLDFELARRIDRLG